MIDREMAIALVRRAIDAHSGPTADEEMVVVETRIIEGEWGWFIPWMAREDRDLGGPPAPGIAPCLVLRETGEMKWLRGGRFRESIVEALGEADAAELLLAMQKRS